MPSGVAFCSLSDTCQYYYVFTKQWLTLLYLYSFSNFHSQLPLSWCIFMASLVAHTVKNPPAMRETWVWSLGWEDPLEKEMATQPSILAPWTVFSSVHGIENSQFHGQRSLAGYGSRGCKELDMTDFHFTLLHSFLNKLDYRCFIPDDMCISFELTLFKGFLPLYHFFIKLEKWNWGLYPYNSYWLWYILGL